MAQQSKPWRPTAADIVDAVREHYGLAGSGLAMEEWALLTEVPLRSIKPHAVDKVNGARPAFYDLNERTIDVMLVRNWAGGRQGHERLALEVKVSRGDYQRETAAKRAPAEASAHRVAYIVPAGLIEAREVPPDWGLLYVHPEPQDNGKRLQWVRGAPRRVPTCDMDYLVSAFARRASRAEEKIRRGEGEGARIAALEGEVASLQERLGRAEGRVRREKARAAIAIGEAFGSEPQVCADCREPIRWARARSTWEHKDPTQHLRCRSEREDADRRRKEATYGARYTYGQAGPVEPLSVREQREAEDDTPAAG